MAAPLPLSLRINTSRIAATALIVIHGLAWAAIAVSQISWLFQVAAGLVVLFSLTHGLRRHAWRLASAAIAAIKLSKDGEVELRYRDGRTIDTRLEMSSVVLHWIIALRLRRDKKALFLILLPDMLDAESWRRLSVQLRVTRQALS